MATRLPLFGFIQLHASGPCRATLWNSDATQTCWSPRDWGALIARENRGFGTHAIRAGIENLRLEFSDHLGKSGIDPLGALRSLLLSERLSSTLQSWVRDGGWVHVWVGSGLHLLVFQNALESLIIRAGEIFRIDPIFSVRIGFILKWIAFFFFWAMTGFRGGLLRVLFTQALKDFILSRGNAPSSVKLLSIACFTDLVFAFFLSLGNPTDPSEFGAGRVHYALSIYGGFYGYMLSREKKWGSLKTHLALVFFSWVPTAGLDLICEGKVSYLIPLFSLISIPLLTTLVLPLSVVCLVGIHVGWGFSGDLLNWISVFWNRVLSLGAELSFKNGFYRELDPSRIYFAAVIAILSTSFFRGVIDHRRRQTRLR